MPVAAWIAGGSSKPARASTLEIGNELHSPVEIHAPACQLRIIAARTPVTNPQASAATFRNVAANAVFASKFAACRAEKNTIIASIGLLKWAQALSLTLKNSHWILKRSCCEQFRPGLRIRSHSSNRRYYVHGHHTWWATRRELNTVRSCGLLSPLASCLTLNDV